MNHVVKIYKKLYIHGKVHKRQFHRRYTGEWKFLSGFDNQTTTEQTIPDELKNRIIKVID